ncbi:hypothetical protein CAEBREN_04361 [Caenorhabditis brenneri]|uniref:F-box domain-containing protein n=1 Tax=Caenorhabditis brenneri TaxID=135651 RepID=G0NI76_CAEBE|nr:hypothetical protein CAEBREN_04361 [Caenorhabditis brenneri]
MDEFKDNILDGVVYTFHFQGVPAATAHEKLTEMTGGELYTLDRVEDLYRRIDDKKFGLKKQDFSQLPEHFLQDVIEYSDWRSRATLRKTCKPLRELADATRFRIKKFVIDGRDGGVEIILDNHAAIYEVYRRATNDLKTILMNPKLEIEEFLLDSIEWNISHRFERSIFEAFPLSHSLHVENFSWEGQSPTDEFITLVRTLNSETLKSISVQYLHLDSFGELSETPQWMNAKKFKSIDCDFPEGSFIHLAHFEKAIVEDADVSLPFEEVIELKDRLLLNPKLDQLKIKLFCRNDRQFKRAFRRLNITDGWANFDYPDSNLKLSLRVTSVYVWFKGPCYVEDENDQDVRRDARMRRLQALEG